MRHRGFAWLLPSLLLLLPLLLVPTACGDDGVFVPIEDAGDGVDAPPPFTGPRPSKRSDIAGVADPASDAIVIFGGDDGPIVAQIPSPAYLDDTWVYRPDVGWTEVASPSSPSARGRNAVALDGVNSRMMLFGGRFRVAGTTGDYTLYNDLWAFDIAQQTWILLDDGTGAAPSPRYFSTAAYSPTQSALYVFGGDADPGALSIDAQLDVWSYDEQNGWQEVTTTGAPPSRRLYMGYAYDSQRDRLVVFGGHVGDFVSPSYNDLYALDLATNQWSLLHSGAGNAPVPRFLTMMTYDDARDRYVIYGGHSDAGTDNDIWAYNPNDDTWALANLGDTLTGAALGCAGNPSEIPAAYVEQDLSAPERRQGGVLTALGGSIWLFGGESDCSDHLDDLWTVTPDGIWTEIIPARSGESCARRNDACACLCI